MGDSNESSSLSSIADSIRDFIFKADDKAKESKGDSGYESHEVRLAERLTIKQPVRFVGGDYH